MLLSHWHGVFTALIICSVALNIDSSPIDGNATHSDLDPGASSRIVGGDDADVGEYPYYAQIPGCGGVIIANEYILTAAHCGDFSGRQVRVGAYRQGVVSDGAIARTCRTYKRDPRFEFRGSCVTCSNFDAPFKFDYALCKLDAPVVVDDSQVSFVLNQNNNSPAPNTPVVAIGLGTTRFQGSVANVLQEVTVNVDRNQDCANAKSSRYSDSYVRSIYNSNSISKENICASVDGGGKDACQGDSGGPLIRRQIINGKRVDTHIGLTSFGISCGSPGLPGVYARTSYAMDFVNRIVCQEDKSPSPFCSAPVVCNGRNEKKMVIRIVTDKWPEDVSYKLERVAWSGQKTHILSADNLSRKNFLYERSLCLKKTENYLFEINDKFGDGLARPAYYSVTVDGKQIWSGSEYGNSDKVFIYADITPKPTRNPTLKPTNKLTRKPTDEPTRKPTNPPTKDPCQNKRGYVYRRPNKRNKSCEDLFEGVKNRIRRKRCKKLDPNNDNQMIKVFCPKYCRKKCLND